MEFIDGEMLGQRMASQMMNIGGVLTVAEQVTSALIAAHAGGCRSMPASTSGASR